MTERLIIFPGPEIRAILDGCKSQTRRVIEPQPGNFAQGVRQLRRTWPGGGEPAGGFRFVNTNHMTRCPFGQPGDLLWVGETWLHINDADDCFDGMGTQTYYRADQINNPLAPKNDREMKRLGLEWHSPIHMPRWACRLWLRVVGVRVERLQEISEEDARAEGCHSNAELVQQLPGGEVVDYTGLFAAERFRDLWDGINTKRGFGWETNPWVFAIGFERVDHQPDTR